ncbi:MULTISPECIES: hypothetical protein [Pseudomonas]|uniref:hypothetical protein n=1 Tax=Pseudomonas TaxID=286 RepID=UPI001112CE87|nr:MULTISPECIES: hypothetical protein [Pseudomonas]
MTTTNIEFAANMAELAEASYVLFNLNDPSTALINSGFSVTQAAEFVTNWAVIDHLPDDPVSDFSATLFKSDADGAYALAFRGAAGVVDDLLYADLGKIVLKSRAIDQVSDLYNLSSCCAGRRVNTNDLEAVA